MTRTLAPCVMSAWASASSVASLPCALSILNSDALYPAIWKAFVKYGKSELTHRVDEVVSGMITPTRPLPAPCRDFSVAMAAKLTSKDETLSPEGIVAVVVVVVVVLPHATAMIAITPTNAVIVTRLSLRNSIWTSCLHPGVLPAAFFPASSGRECAGNRSTQSMASRLVAFAGPEHRLRTGVCQ